MYCLQTIHEPAYVILTLFQFFNQVVNRLRENYSPPETFLKIYVAFPPPFVDPRVIGRSRGYHGFLENLAK